MSMSISKAVMARSDYQPLLDLDDGYSHRSTVVIPDDLLDDAMFESLFQATESCDKGLHRVIGAIIAARAGKFDKSIPRLIAAPEMLLAYFRANLKDGWVYMKDQTDGHMYPYLVTKVKYDDGESRSRNADPSVIISLAASGPSEDGKASGTSIHLGSSDVLRKKVSDVLTSRGIYVETPDLREQYQEGLAYYEQVMAEGFTHQYLMNGSALSYLRDEGKDWNEDRHVPNPHSVVNRKVIHDLPSRELGPQNVFTESAVFLKSGGSKVDEALDEDDDQPRKKGRSRDEEEYGVGKVPVHFKVRFFDLRIHRFGWVNALNLTRYEYDKTLIDKIVLPADQRNLLDILTSNLDDFTGDVIEGKSAGNVVLCKGIPGVGKTLTAEVYSELIERPLYSIHSGVLGLTADKIRTNLEIVFQRVKRWNCVLLLDEADVFVLERGESIEQNAIVAEFLRTLEYFDGLMFMTTNRAKDIDDAILSRSAAIIDYQIPDIPDTREIWLVQARNQGAEKEVEKIVDDLVAAFEHITPRDIKMLLRLSLRVAKGNDIPLTPEVFQRCSMFRGLHYKAGSRT